MKVVYENPEQPWKPGEVVLAQRVVRLTDPAYYVPENPHTDDAGFLPHDGGERPQWLDGCLTQVRFRRGDVSSPITMIAGADDLPTTLRWPYRAGEHFPGDIVAFRIVGEQRSENMKDRSENIGLEQRYEVRKLTNPGKALDCIVLEFDDPIARKGIEAWANALCAEYPAKDYGRVASDVYNKLASYGYYDDASASENGDDPEQFASGNPVPFVDKPRSPSDATGHQYQDVYTEDERRHRNELAARTLTPVPGMDEWMHDVLREARRHDFRVAALPVGSRVQDAIDIADIMIEREDSE